MRIIADAFGGDNAPLEIMKGCAAAVEEFGIEIILSGSEEKIRACAKENNISLKGIEILEAPDVMTMHDNPKEIIKSKQSSSMAVGLKALSEGKGDAFISAGSTGALVFGSTFIVKRLKGIKRAAFGSFFPTMSGGHFFLMDEGANVDCRPEMLLQFGIMGSTYVSALEGIDNPTVGLLNIGVEDSKGGQLQMDSYELLKNSELNFIGNVEARDLVTGVCDVVVADGFSGNVFLKASEGMAFSLMRMIKDIFKKNILTKLAALLVLPHMKGLKKTMDYTEIGGAPIIGVKRLVFKAHGNSDAKAFKSAIRGAVSCVSSNMVEKLESAIKSTEKNDENEKA